MGRLLVPTLLTTLVLALAGCVGSDAVEGDVDAASAVANATVYADDRITIETLESATDEIEAPTLAAAPQWRLGEWWSIRLTDDFVDGEHLTTRVVAGAESDAFLVGMPSHDFSNAIMVFHIPGFGQVGKSDLSFEIHDCLFEPLKFPLELDKTWNTQFECRDVTATVVETTATTATIEIIGEGDMITVVYDAELRAISYLRKEGYGGFEVTDHGYAFHTDKPALMGQVTVPHMHDVIFQHGRIAGAIWGGSALPTGLGPHGPMDEVEVASTYDRVSFAIILGNLAPGAPAGGYYKETATAPDGTAYELEMMPDDASRFKIQDFKHDAPGGVWQFQHIAAGPGLVLSEGIAYHVYEVVLPQGTILPSVGEHQHGDPCAHGC